jgi:hypothetical protein
MNVKIRTHKIIILFWKKRGHIVSFLGIHEAYMGILKAYMGIHKHIRFWQALYLQCCIRHPKSQNFFYPALAALLLKLLLYILFVTVIILCYLPFVIVVPLRALLHYCYSFFCVHGLAYPFRIFLEILQILIFGILSQIWKENYSTLDAIFWDEHQFLILNKLFSRRLVIQPLARQT